MLSDTHALLWLRMFADAAIEDEIHTITDEASTDDNKADCSSASVCSWGMVAERQGRSSLNWRSFAICWGTPEWIHCEPPPAACVILCVQDTSSPDPVDSSAAVNAFDMWANATMPPKGGARVSQVVIVAGRKA